MKRAAFAVLASLLSAAYWWIVFTIVYADTLFAGDRNPAAQPRPDSEVLWRGGLTIVIGVVAYAVVLIAWRRLTTRAGRPRQRQAD